jgi:hypothetical protein
MYRNNRPMLDFRRDARVEPPTAGAERIRQAGGAGAPTAVGRSEARLAVVELPASTAAFTVCSRRRSESKSRADHDWDRPTRAVVVDVAEALFDEPVDIGQTADEAELELTHLCRDGRPASVTYINMYSPEFWRNVRCCVLRSADGTTNLAVVVSTSRAYVNATRITLDAELNKRNHHEPRPCGDACETLVPAASTARVRSR